MLFPYDKLRNEQGNMIKAIEDALDMLLNNPQDYQGNIDTIKEYSRESQARQLLEIINKKVG